MSTHEHAAYRSHALPDGRHLAFSDTGPADASDVLLCLPGVLETRQTFAPLLQARPVGLRCISVDLCGRGDSDALPDDRGYSMARYRADLRDFIAREIPATARLHLLGTSMGGLLAFYLLADEPARVRSLLLNDVGLTLQWSSLLALSRLMRSAHKTLDSTSLARTLRVTPGVLADVQRPAHFDLPYRRSLRGMVFSDLLTGYSGRLRLVRGGDSPVCLPAQVRQWRALGPHTEVLEVARAAHPVPFSTEVCAFLLQDLTCSPDAGAAPDPAAVPASGPASLWRWLRGRRAPRG